MMREGGGLGNKTELITNKGRVPRVKHLCRGLGLVQNCRVQTASATPICSLHRLLRYLFIISFTYFDSISSNYVRRFGCVTLGFVIQNGENEHQMCKQVGSKPCLVERATG
jgi:hypothetical protein